MDNRTFMRHLSRNTGLDSAAANNMAELLTDIVSRRLAELDTIAIPGFGTFTAEKTDEYVATAEDGSRTLMPPAIQVSFTPGTRLSKDASPKK